MNTETTKGKTMKITQAQTAAMRTIWAENENDGYTPPGMVNAAVGLHIGNHEGNNWVGGWSIKKFAKHCISRPMFARLYDHKVTVGCRYSTHGSGNVFAGRGGDRVFININAPKEVTDAVDAALAN